MKRMIVAAGLISALSLVSLAEDGKGFDITEGTPAPQKGATGIEAKTLLDNTATAEADNEARARRGEKAAPKDDFPAGEAKVMLDADKAVKKDDARASRGEQAAPKDDFSADKAKVMLNADKEVKKDEKRATKKENEARTLEMLDLD